MRAARPLTIVAALVAGALAAGACSGSDAAESDPEAATTTTVEQTAVTLTAGEAAVSSAGPEVTLDDNAKQDMVGAAQRYVDAAIVGPLVDGKVGDAYASMFDGTVAANAAGADRAALTDEGVPPITGTPTVTASPVRIDGLANGGGEVTLLATSFTLGITGATDQGALTIQRTTELTFAPVNGAWIVTAYRVSVGRDLGGALTTTTAVAGT
jgi:hypothetical protein